MMCEGLAIQVQLQLDEVDVTLVSIRMSPVIQLQLFL